MQHNLYIQQSFYITTRRQFINIYVSCSRSEAADAESDSEPDSSHWLDNIPNSASLACCCSKCCFRHFILLF